MRVNRKVSIWKHVRLADGKWRYCRPVLDAKGKIVSDMVMVKGREEHHAEGNYVISFYNPKLTWQKCGRKPADAVVAAERQRALFKAMEHGIVERPKKSQTTGTIDEAVTAYLEELQAKVGNGSKRPQTHAASKQILREFQAYCERKGKKSLSKITKLDLLNYAGWAHQHSPTKSRRTANTKFVRVNQFLKAQGIFIATNADAPKYTKNPPVLVYSEEQLGRFFAKCSPRQRPIFKTFQMAGLRESELVFLTFDRLHLDRGVIRIDENPKYDFMPKAYQCRDVYIPPELVEELRKVKPMAGCDLVFPTRNGTPNDKLLIMCKRIAKNAGMVQDDWRLHRWRSTYATHCLRQGMDIASLRDQMGHSDLKSIERYLRALDQDKRAEKVTLVWAKAA
ncbi:MAG TPA: site-specific integrase [Terriglobales bacterium]|nr:site-specific integrase [Terriglobales bacterium]